MQVIALALTSLLSFAAHDTAVTNSGGGVSVTALTELIDQAPNNGSALGFKVATNGRRTFVGAPGANGTGKVCIYDTKTGSFLFDLVADDGMPNDQFGISISVAGQFVLVGAPGSGASHSGSTAYLFVVGPHSAQQLIKFLPSDGDDLNEFGRDVAICTATSTALIAAPSDHDEGLYSGAVYLFDLTTGAELAKLKGADIDAFDYFGSSVAVSGTTAVIGAAGIFPGGDTAGAAYVFDLATGLQTRKLIADDGSVRDLFGTSIAVDANVAIIGSPGYDVFVGIDFFGSPYYHNYSGAAYVFDVTTGEQLEQLLPAISNYGLSFGTSVAMDGEMFVIGAPGFSFVQENYGAAYVFEASYLFETGYAFGYGLGILSPLKGPLTISEKARILAPDPIYSDAFGKSVGIMGKAIVSGTPGHDHSPLYSSSGAAYTYLLQ